MHRFTDFQISIATGRFTLPVVAFACLLLWGLTPDNWSEGISLLVAALSAYLLIELNTTFALIRTRTAFHVCLYLFFVTMCYFLHPAQPFMVIPFLFLLALFPLFKSYESPQSSGHIFNSFLLIGAGSLIFPPLLFFVPLFYIGMIHLRSLSVRTFFAGIVGLGVPYWLLFSHAFYHDQMELFYRPLQELVSLQAIDYGQLTPHQLLNGGAITLLSLASIVNYFQVSFWDKVCTRIFLSFLIALEVWIYLLGILQPQHFNVLLSIQLILCSILTGHWFTLTHNRFTGIFFALSFVILVALMIYNVWMQFFNS